MCDNVLVEGVSGCDQAHPAGMQEDVALELGANAGSARLQMQAATSERTPSTTNRSGNFTTIAVSESLAHTLKATRASDSGHSHSYGTGPAMVQSDRANRTIREVARYNDITTTESPQLTETSANISEPVALYSETNNSRTVRPSGVLLELGAINHTVIRGHPNEFSFYKAFRPVRDVLREKGWILWATLGVVILGICILTLCCALQKAKPHIRKRRAKLKAASHPKSSFSRRSTRDSFGSRGSLAKKILTEKVKEFTGKDDYQYGDVAKAVITRSGHGIHKAFLKTGDASKTLLAKMSHG